MRVWGLLLTAIALVLGLAWHLLVPSPPPVPVAAEVPYAKVLGAPRPHADKARLPELAMHLGWSRDGGAVIAHQEDGTIRRWEIATGASTAIAQTASVFAHCPQGERLLVNLGGNTVLLSLTDGAFTRLAEGRQDHAAVSADCSVLAMANEDKPTVRLWRSDGSWREVPTAQPVRNSLTLSADGRFLAAAGGTWSANEGHRTVVEVFDLGDAGASRTATHDSPEEVLGMWAMAFSADGAGLMLGSQIQGQSGLRHIETQSGAVRWGHDGFSSYWVRALAVSLDGITLATGDEKGFLRLWDADTGTRLAEYGTGLVIQSLAFSPDGRWLAIGLWNGTIGIASVKSLLKL